MEFLRNEGRLLLATSSSLIILELNASSGHWEKTHSVHLSFGSVLPTSREALQNMYLFLYCVIFLFADLMRKSQRLQLAME